MLTYSELGEIRELILAILAYGAKTTITRDVAHFFQKTFIEKKMSSPVNAVVPSQNPANAHSYRIIVCLTWRKELVQMTYPDERPEWVYREDCGSYSQFRWSLRCKNNKDIVQLVVKHNTCLNSLFMQPYCVNCQMRETWHQPCTTPEDVFYALAIQPTNICNDAILPLVQHSYCELGNNCGLPSTHASCKIFPYQISEEQRSHKEEDVGVESKD